MYFGQLTFAEVPNAARLFAVAYRTAVEKGFVPICRVLTALHFPSGKFISERTWSTRLV